MARRSLRRDGRACRRIPIRHFVDHGGNVQPGAATDEFLQKVYPAIYAKGTHTVAKPGDKIAVAGLDWRIVASAGEMIKTALPGAGKPNPVCAGYKPKDPDPSENAQSVGSVVTFGKFRVAHLGDLTWNKESDLMCPANRVGTVDLFIVSHHGQAISNSEVLVHGLRPRVPIMNNGTRKGGQPDAMKVIYSSPGLEDLWQMHFSLLSGQEYTVPVCSSRTRSTSRRATVPVAAAAAPPPGPGASARRPCTTARPIGSRCWHGRDPARSRSRMAAMGSTRVTRRGGQEALSVYGLSLMDLAAHGSQHSSTAISPLAINH
jgi:hypothetical protein